jgi:CRP/FNR family transcriptional regulator, cyclic AMP receptor protein
MVTMTILSKLFKKGETIAFKKNEFFLSSQKSPKGIYQITQGYIYSYSESKTHKKRIQTVLKKDDIFPIAWAITSVRNKMFVQALTDGTAQLIKKEDFLDYVNSSHKAALEIISVLLVYLNTYVDRVENLEYDTVREKVINRILFFEKRFGNKNEKGVMIDLPITHKLIAESISVSRENVTRELKILEKEKVISFKNRQLFITDVKKLEELLR